MGVSIRDEVTKRIAAAQGIVAEELRNAFVRLGEESVIKVRDRSPQESWNDITGNLRQSIGYGVYEAGREYIKAAAKGETDALLGEVAAQYRDSVALVIAAGMNYASFVEAKPGKDVLASAELWARREAEPRIAKAIEQAVKRIQP